MSRLLSELIGAREPGFSLMIRRLERSSGQPAADIRLASEVTSKMGQKARELGLDPHDSSGPELHSALQKMVGLHDQHLGKILGITERSDTRDVLEAVASAATKMEIPHQAWVIKTAVARRLLTLRPPKTLMKLLGFRSVDSMLKRESVAEIYIGAQICESSLWQKRFASELKALTPQDFETRPIEIICAKPERWAGPAKAFARLKKHNVAISHEMGAIMLLPLAKSDIRGLCITLLPLLLETINEIRMQSAYFKLKQVYPRFGRIIAAAYQKESPSVIKLDNVSLAWREVHRHFGSKADSSFDFFEPHLAADDLRLMRAEETLIYLEPSLAFWSGIDYVGAASSHRPVSFNLMDAAISYVNNLSYGQHSVHHMRASLWNKLLGSYMSQKVIEADILRQLDQQLAGRPASPLRLEQVMA